MLKFFSLTYALTWIYFIVAGLLSSEASVLRTALLLLGTLAPALIALGLTAWSEGMTGLNAIFRRMWMWPSSARWYVFAAGYLAGLKLAVALIHRVVVGAWPRFGVEPWYVIAVATVVSTPIQAGEEIGWRGYALPRLALRFGLARASLILGLVWAFWHLPLFFIPGVHNFGQSFPLFFLAGVALSVAIAWLYVRTGGSLLTTMLMHSAINQTTSVVPTDVPGAIDPFALSTSLAAWLFLALLWMSALYFLFRMKTIRVPL